ncbi:imidazole glycerol phosphate synthase subunit HisH [Cognatiluteimonas telluris]|uniref:imidazole glycerol phosphate synthase subunit HisH n=1 Tax=Cognatiluteimonas telluris TaxID=1104775 RepID=UPI00140786BE|nr:imidazole glycerol phosphate synthase subunit HisH [Lysobacter telluris]
MIDVAVIDAGGANLASVCHAVERAGALPRRVRDAAALGAPDRIILPGVGAAAPAMRCLRERGLDIALGGATAPLLGICLGMQLLFEHSEEGDVECLGLLPGRVRRLRGTAGARVPHMGWNSLEDVREAPWLRGIDDGDQAYFVHGYAAAVTPDCMAACGHGSERFAAIVQRGTRHGAQFHPERSATTGARLLANFLGTGSG